MFRLGRGGAVRIERVGRGEIRFAGFTDRRVSNLMTWFDYREGDPPLLELADVVYDPRLRCLYDLDGRRIDATRVIHVEPGAPAPANVKMAAVEQETMPEAIVVPPKLRREAGPVLFLGEAHDHWGHLLTDTLGRMWALDLVDPALPVLFAPDPKRRLDPPHVGSMLDLVGLDRRRILRPQRATLFERVLCPIAALQLTRVYEGFERPHRRAAGRAIAGRAVPDRPVWLSRQGLGAGHRRPEGEAALEARLEREGWAMVRPEALDLPAQMALFNGVHPVAGTYGSALHGVLFRAREDGQPLATLLPEQFAHPPRFAMIDAVKGSRALHANVLRPAGPDDRWRIEVEAALAALDDAGFLRATGRIGL